MAPTALGSSTASSSKAGIITNSSGERHIPASTRADGSVRKEIKVRPGYRPPEDVEIYKNRTAQAFRNRGTGGVPGATFTEPTESTPKSTRRNRSGQKKGEPVEGAPPNGEVVEPQTDGVEAKQTAESAAAEPVDPEVEKEKDARKLAKKLRQARELQQKKLDGGALLPEQFEKVIRINELIRQLDALGFDTEGQKKS